MQPNKLITHLSQTQRNECQQLENANNNNQKKTSNA